MACNGMLAGLVAITAPCAFVNANSSVIIGVMAASSYVSGAAERAHPQDRRPCGAISVMATAGWLGAVSLGIFADGTYGAGGTASARRAIFGVAGQGVTGLLYGDTSQFLCQLLAPPSAWHGRRARSSSSRSSTRLRACASRRTSELEGLDVPEFGMRQYPEDVVVAEA